MIIHGDILEWAARYDGPKFHALLCDPPYELGFMGKHWDKSGLVFDPATWAALGEHMHPGAFGMAFASSRGWHRLACAIEDAGFTIHPSIFVWGFGSGFPKATRIDTQVDKAAGAEREVVGRQVKGSSPLPGNHNGAWTDGQADGEFDITAPATPLAQTWAGHRYGLQAIKPACEPVIVFQKPYAGKPVECIVRTGAGALWVDGGRIGCTDKAKFPYGVVSRTESTYGNGKGVYDDRERPNDSNPSGRWPANFALIHSPNCNGECAPECAVRRLGEQSGDTSQGHWTHKRNIGGNGIYGGGGYADNDEGRKLADTGTAARYFFQAQWDQLDAADPVKYQAKASRRERDAGLDGMPERIGGTMDGGAIVSDGRNAPKTGRILVRNPHPTVKPIALIEHLATLLLPPAEYAPRRIMIPFAGSGSEMIGATLAGWDEVVGIEREVEYVEIAEKRLAYWREQREEKVKEAESQMSLLEAVG